MRRDPGAFTDGTFDLLVVGGGITGAGVALDAALRGWRVGLIDKGDFASGTSSASSKLVHGGLRYLEHGDFGLVYEALHERRLLLRNAPHLVRPLQFVIPFYRGQRVPRWKWRTGLTLYDLLAGRSNLRRSRPLTAARLQREFPGLRAAGLTGGAAYYDAQMDDARLCIEVVQTAAAHGAMVGNYLEAVAFERAGGHITGVGVCDVLTGQAFSVRARQVLNATGPWVDAVCRLAGDDPAPHLQPTKGVHLLAPGRGLTTAFLLLHPADGRVFFVIPWMGDRRPGEPPGEADKTLIGTTDTLTEEGPDGLAVRPQEVGYLLEGFNHYFTPPLRPDEVLGSFAGLRPLLRPPRPGEPSSRSREFRIFRSAGGPWSVAGGKYTTYRRMAEQVTDLIGTRLGCRRPGRTRDLPLDGAPCVPWAVFEPAAVTDLCRRHGLDPAASRHLVRRYGRRAADVAACLEAGPDLAKAVMPGEPDLRVEFVYQREYEMAIEPSDYLLRRTHLGLFRPGLLRSFVPPGFDDERS